MLSKHAGQLTKSYSRALGKPIVREMEAGWICPKTHANEINSIGPLNTQFGTFDIYCTGRHLCLPGLKVTKQLVVLSTLNEAVGERGASELLIATRDSRLNRSTRSHGQIGAPEHVAESIG
jgi:hypothetical protein